ncbi:MAG: tetratricopeptide repeat protein [Cyanobacteriota bacterium]|nr:tetratricopeptide repeat protein [Cyanobacteriota bacterium]
MNDSPVDALLQDLKNPQEAVRQRATQELWQIWFQQKGSQGCELLLQSQSLIDEGNMSEAEALLTGLIDGQPDFAEAWNRRAVLYYLQDRFPEAVEDCQVVIRLNPHHFGAWHGLGLCLAALGEYRQAISAFRQALAIQPFALMNQRLILECTVLLN